MEQTNPDALVTALQRFIDARISSAVVKLRGVGIPPDLMGGDDSEARRLLRAELARALGQELKF